MLSKIFSVLTCVCIVSVLVFNAGTTEAKTLKVSYNVAEGSSWDKGAQRFKKLVEERSDGRHKVELYPNASLAQGNDRVEIEMTQSGGIDFLIKSTMWLPALDKRFAIIQMPFQFPNHDVAEEVMDGPAGQELLDILPKHRLEGLAWGVNGFRQVTNSEREISEPEDLDGLKMRVPGIDLSQDIFKTLGANPTTMSFAEVFTALQTGTVDGQENPLSLIWSSRFFEVQDYVTLWNYMYDAICFIASESLWKDLSEEDKEMFSRAAKEAMDYERRVVREEDKTLPGKLENEGMKITELTTEEMEAFQEQIQPVYDEYKEKLGKETVELFEEEVQKATN